MDTMVHFPCILPQKGTHPLKEETRTPSLGTYNLYRGHVVRLLPPPPALSVYSSRSVSPSELPVSLLHLELLSPGLPHTLARTVFPAVASLGGPSAWDSCQFSLI